MWKLLQALRGSRDRNATQGSRPNSRVSQIGAVELACLLVDAPGNVILFDLREFSEIEAYPYTVGGALLTFNVNVDALVPWIPAGAVVILYATGNIPPRHACLHLLSETSSFYALKGGLRSWRKAGLALEDIVLGDRRSLDNR